MCPILEKWASWLKYGLGNTKTRLRADDREHQLQFYSPENAKAIWEALNHPKLRKLAWLMERRKWTKVCRILREDHACEQVFSSLHGVVIEAIFLPYQPPLDLIFDYMISERNAAHWYLNRGLIDYTDRRSDLRDRVYIQHALLRYFRPDELAIFKPKLVHNPVTDVYHFALEVATRDPQMQCERNRLRGSNVFVGYPCCTYSLLTEAGFKPSPLEYHKTIVSAWDLGIAAYPESSGMSRDMIEYCQEHDRNCASLLYLCRNAIRRQMVSLDIRYFQQLNVPVEIEKFLTLENVDCPIFRKYTSKPFPNLDFQHFCRSPQDDTNYHSFCII